MSNNRFNQNQYNPEELVKELDHTAIPFNRAGNLYREKTSSLQAKLEDMIANSFGIQEIDHIFILPIFDKNNNLEDVLCRAYFDTKDVSNGDIVRTGRGRVSNGGRFNVVQYMGGAAVATGDFQLSDKFKKVFAAVALSDDDKLHVNSIKDNPNVAVLDIDTNAILSVALAIDDSNSPYNFSILDATRINNDDYMLLFTKHIETGAGKRGRHKGRRINYGELDRAFAKQSARYNSGNSRHF